MVLTTTPSQISKSHCCNLCLFCATLHQSRSTIFVCVLLSWEMWYFLCVCVLVGYPTKKRRCVSSVRHFLLYTLHYTMPQHYTTLHCTTLHILSLSLWRVVDSLTILNLVYGILAYWYCYQCWYTEKTKHTYIQNEEVGLNLSGIVLKVPILGGI